MKKKLCASLSLFLLAGGYGLTLSAQSPKIVVGIMVDQLRTDYIEQLRPYFGTNGFNRLISEGVYIPDLDFSNTVSDSPSGTTVVYTGAWPATSGVASAESLEHSPENLKVSTLADEYFINGGALTKIYAIGSDPQSAIISAGHAGNAALWIDEISGKWTVPSYYGTLPPVFANRNRISPPLSKLSTSSWRPLNTAATYPFAKSWNNGDFSYTFTAGSRDGLKQFKGSGLLNTEMTDAAIDLLKTMASGSGGMLNLKYTAAPIEFDYDGDNRPELIDTYVRLDRELGRLLDTLDKDYGKGNAFVFVSSTGYAREPEIPDRDARIPTGEVTLKQVESLLNSYLSATYGNADYISLIKNGKLYLNGKELSKRNISEKDLRSEAKNFLLRMSGVSDVWTIDEVYSSTDAKARELALATDAKHAPDLYLSFTPGWTVTDDNVYPTVSEKVRLSSPSTPAFILWEGIEPQTITYPVEATVLAPTIASQINIRAPNAAAAKPLVLTKKK